MKSNNKGFTLVELLAVIVILAVVMTMAVTAVGPLMARARKGALGEEGLQLIESAKTALQLEQMKATSKIKATSTVCFSLSYLNKGNYYDKGSSEGYTGSVLVKYVASTKSYQYYFWISNGTYKFENIQDSAYDYEKATDGSPGSEMCKNNNSSVNVYCTGDSCKTCTGLSTTATNDLPSKCKGK